MTETRKLAAILVAYVVGYSRLAGRMRIAPSRTSGACAATSSCPRASALACGVRPCGAVKSTQRSLYDLAYCVGTGSTLSASQICIDPASRFAQRKYGSAVSMTSCKAGGEGA
jgi:hypothetical protein